MVRDVVCPRENTCCRCDECCQRLLDIIEWEIKEPAYEVASGDKISEAVRVVTIMDHAPDAVKSMFANHLWNGDAVLIR